MLLQLNTKFSVSVGLFVSYLLERPDRASHFPTCRLAECISEKVAVHTLSPGADGRGALEEALTGRPHGIGAVGCLCPPNPYAAVQAASTSKCKTVFWRWGLLKIFTYLFI